MIATHGDVQPPHRCSARNQFPPRQRSSYRPTACLAEEVLTCRQRKFARENLFIGVKMPVTPNAHNLLSELNITLTRTLKIEGLLGIVWTCRFSGDILTPR